MLRPVLLCLAVGLASALDLHDGLMLRISDVFSFSYELSFDDGPPFKGYQWYDAINNKSRLDIEGESYVFIESSPQFEYGVETWTFPLSDTEANANINYCINTTGASYSPMPGRFTIFPQITGFLPIGAETVRGEVVEIWQSSTLHHYFYIEIIFYCVNRPDKNGVMQKVPIRCFLNIHNSGVNRRFNQLGIVGTLEVLYRCSGYPSSDFTTSIPWFVGKSKTTLNTNTRTMKIEIFNYDTSPIDPDVFDISKGLKCLEKRRTDQEGTDFFFAQPHLRFPMWLGTELDPFGSFQSEYNKQYGSETERNWRQEIYMKNLKRIQEHNQGNHGYKLAVNHLADRTDDELLAMLTGRILTDAPSNALPFPYNEAEIEAMSTDLPDCFDWRDHGAVMQVKNQGGCGSCWAFAAVGAIEGAVFLHSNRTVRMSLSEQTLVDCSWGFGNIGCMGGLPEYSFDFAKKYPIPTDFAYGGYKTVMGYCNMQNVRKGFSITDYVQLPSNEKAFKIAIFKHGPVAVAIGVTWRMVYYSSGVFSDPKCESRIKGLRHAVLVVGYGTLDGQKYWLIKNSWGMQFGQDGYILMAMANNTCGVTTYGQYVTI